MQVWAGDGDPGPSGRAAGGTAGSRAGGSAWAARRGRGRAPRAARGETRRWRPAPGAAAGTKFSRITKVGTKQTLDHFTLNNI